MNQTLRVKCTQAQWILPTGSIIWTSMTKRRYILHHVWFHSSHNPWKSHSSKKKKYIELFGGVRKGFALEQFFHVEIMVRELVNWLLIAATLLIKLNCENRRKLMLLIWMQQKFRLMITLEGSIRVDMTVHACVSLMCTCVGPACLLCWFGASENAFFGLCQSLVKDLASNQGGRDSVPSWTCALCHELLCDINNLIPLKYNFALEKKYQH